ncbi:hypothetical protein Taro_044088 [Colocasia esculenta]|uniref:Uncharacterized protein n=1 Tax=Colocasia esculenta TaxID=4460 RepID=A0A843X208_COLES|nr:hypothetical protein [Colocasia esculenta]
MLSPRGRHTERGKCRVVIGLRVLREALVEHVVCMLFTWELGPESLKVPGMGLQLCGLQVWCWLASTILWPYCVVVEGQLDLSSVTARLRGSSCVVLSRLVEVLPVVVCPGGGMILVVDPWWYLVVVVVEVDWCSVEVCGVTFHVLCFYSSLGAYSVDTTCQAVAFWFPVFKLFVLVVLVLRWCHPLRAGDVLVVLGARRRWSFRREGPNGSALLVEPFRVSGSVDGDRENRVLSVGRGSGSRGRYNWIWLRVGAGRTLYQGAWQPKQAAVGGQPPVPPPAVPEQQAYPEEEQPAVQQASGTGSTWASRRRTTITEDRTALLERFLRLRPPMFFGEYDPDKAESWTHELERTFETMECVEEDQDFTTKGTVPLKDPYTQAQLVFLQPEGNYNPLDTTPGPPSQQKGKTHPESHQVFLHNRREQHHPGYHQVFLPTEGNKSQNEMKGCP